MYIVLILIILKFFMTNAQVPEILLENVNYRSTSTDLYVFEDPNGKYSIYEVAGSQFKPNFKKRSPDSINLSAATDVYWLNFRVRNNTDRDGEWVFDFKYWNYINFYLESDQGFSEKKTGTYIPFNDRDYGVADNCFILVPLKAGATKTCFVRLEVNRKTELVPTNLAFKATPRTLVDQHEREVRGIIFLFLGFYLVMFLYNFFIYFSTKDRAYLFYLGMIIAFSYYTLQNSGYLFSIFGFIEFLPERRTIFDALNTILVSVASILFVREFLNIKERYPTWDRIFKYTIVAILIMHAIKIVDFEIGLMLSNLISLFFIVCIVIVIVKSQGYPSASFLLYAIMFSVVGSFINIFASLGLLPFNDFTVIYAMPIGSCAEMVLFSFALGNKIKILTQENERKQLQIIEQLQENEKLQTKINRELEQKVYERTLAISQHEEILEKEKYKSDQLLLNILPEFTANELKDRGSTQPRSYPQVSVLFTDFVGFTKISEKLNPIELVRELDYCFRAFDDIVETNGLEKIKTFGDSYMAAASVPVEDLDGARKAVKTGLAMQKFMDKWNKEKVEKGEQAWELRVGIHTGPITAGVVGKKKFAFDIWGDTVNLAARMESSGEPNKVNISGTTFELVKDYFQCKHRGKVNAKNKGEIDMYFVEKLETSD